MLLALAMAGIAEGIGLSALLPLLGTAISGQTQSGQLPTADALSGQTGIEQTITDAIRYLGIEPSAAVFLLVIISGIVLKSGLVLLAKKQVGYTVAQMATDLRLDMLRALLDARWEYYLRQPIGSLANAVATEAMRASNAYLCAAIMASYMIQAIVFLCVAILISWKATLAALAAVIVILTILGRFIRKARRAGVKQTKLLQSLLAQLTDSLQSIKSLKAMAREELADSVLQNDTHFLNKALRKQVFNKEALRAMQEPMITVFLALGFYAAMVFMKLPLSTVTVLVFLLARLMTQLGKVQSQYQKMLISESAYWSLQKKIKEARQEHETALGSQTPPFSHAIHMDDVSFSYGERIVLQNASFLFPAGSFTAIIGPSGVGKTTVVDLMTGLLLPQEGKVWIDDLPLEEIDLKAWRRMIGYVPQDTLLLHDSVFANITLGDPQLDEEDVKQALRAAGAWEFVEDMPQGMGSSVGERGGVLSGGQRQRIAIARALVHRPKLLIMDEATSALDPESEMAIGQTLQKLHGKLTIVAISHQPTLIKAADRAYRLQDSSAILVEAESDNDSQPDAHGDQTRHLTSSHL
jgi:ATP-binding cassette subfamily C protein